MAILVLLEDTVGSILLVILVLSAVVILEKAVSVTVGGVLLVILVLLAVMLLEKAVGVAISVILAVAGGGSPHRRWHRNFSIVGL